MKEILIKLAAYNVWANHRFIYRLQELPEERWMQTLPSSFNSFYKTILHMWDAESAWWQRMRLHEHIVFPSMSFEPSFNDACNGLISQSMEWEDFMRNSLTDDMLQSNLSYKTKSGDAFTQPMQEVLHHVFNHSTYHRGQLVCMLRAAGEERIPISDFIYYTRQ